MRVLVGQKNLRETISALSFEKALVWDCETTGLSSFHAAEMFSLSISTLEGQSYYFNFNRGADIPEDFVLKYEDLQPIMNTKRLWIGHNAKFDLHFCEKAGIRPRGKIADTKCLARLYENHHHAWVPNGGYSLSACAKRWLDQPKDDRVMTWMNENLAYTVMPGSSGKDYHFEAVPFSIISEYAMIDAEVTAKLYNFLMSNMYETPMLDAEIELTKILFHVEQTGVRIDEAFIEEAMAFEQIRLNQAADVLPEDFVDSAKYLAPKLEALGFEIPQTEAGNDQVTDEVLRQKQTELSGAVLKYRDANKRLNTYWKAYDELPDERSDLHTDFDAAGTTTGRFACRNPNLQNIPSDDDTRYPVRRAFIARPKHKLVSIDYKAVEFRLALIYSGELEMIEKIKQGHDVHQAAADLAGITRKQAKAFNFGIMFGMGDATLAGKLGLNVADARALKRQYFKALPKLEQFIKHCQGVMKNRGSISNLFGRKYYLDDKKYAYKATNLLIQGSAADMMKMAIIKCFKLIKDRQVKSRILLTIHDELVFEVADGEDWLIPHLKEAMETAYQNDVLTLECSVEVGLDLHNMDAL